MNYTSNKIYLIAIDKPSERIELQFPPDSVANERSVDIAKLKTVNRNNPIAQSGGGDENISFSLQYFADDGDLDKVIKNCNWVKSLAYDRQKVKFIMGTLFDDFEFYISSVKISYEKFVSGQDFKPAYAKIDLSLQIANKNDFNASKFKN
jgi:hypothetical protein